MNATHCKSGKCYQVTALRKPEYLAVGEVYRATGGGDALGMHRVADGAGTYLRRWDQTFVDVVEVQS